MKEQHCSAELVDTRYLHHFYLQVLYIANTLRFRELPWAMATSWEESPAGFGSLCWASTLGEKLPLLHSPVWPGDAPAPRVLGADPSISGKPAPVGTLVSSGCCNGHYRRSSSPVLEAGIPDPAVGRAGPPEACRRLSPPHVLTGSSL